MIAWVLGVILVPVLFLIVVLGGWKRTLETVQHNDACVDCWWMQLLGPRLSMQVLSNALWLSSPLGLVRRAGLRRQGHATLATARKFQHKDPYSPDSVSGDGELSRLLFVGSSTFTFWHHLKRDIHAALRSNQGLVVAPPVLNLAFGGSTTDMVHTHTIPALALFPSAPIVIVYFCGTNDLTFGGGGLGGRKLAISNAVHGFARFVDAVQSKCSRAAVVYLAINTTPFSRLSGGRARVDDIAEVNTRVKQFITQSRSLDSMSMCFVDLDACGWSNDMSCYLGDGHHLNEKGHVLLARLLAPHITAMSNDSKITSN